MSDRVPVEGREPLRWRIVFRVLDAVTLLACFAVYVAAPVLFVGMYLWFLAGAP